MKGPSRAGMNGRNRTGMAGRNRTGMKGRNRTGMAVESAGAAPARPVDGTLVLWMVLLTFLWGVNSATVKMVTTAMAPLMSAGLRGVVALTATTLYGLARGEPMGYAGRERLHVLVIGCLFALEFIFLYSAAPFTNAGHLSLFVQIAPILVAGGAHFLLPGERLHLFKSAGLLLAFGGVVLLFWDELFFQQSGLWRGDLLAIASAFSWASTTLYMKRFLTSHFSGFRLLHAQLLVSTPLLLGASLLLEPLPLAGLGPGSLLLIFFQGVVVAFLASLAWMSLLTRYPASSMQSFTFLASVWGVLAGVLLLSETVSLLMAAGMALIAAGILLVNRPPRRALQTE